MGHYRIAGNDYFINILPVDTCGISRGGQSLVDTLGCKRLEFCQTILPGKIHPRQDVFPAADLLIIIRGYADYVPGHQIPEIYHNRCRSEINCRPVHALCRVILLQIEKAVSARHKTDSAGHFPFAVPENTGDLPQHFKGSVHLFCHRSPGLLDTPEKP